MLLIASTRFNTKTWVENQKWREKNNWNGCIYGTPIKIAEKLMPLATIIIIEMHNDENMIKGIGLIRNAIMTNKYYKIYSEGNYNRYTYMSKYRIDRSDMTNEEKKVINKMEILLFTGSHHFKRGQGITAVPEWLLGSNFNKLLKTMFLNRFKTEN